MNKTIFNIIILIIIACICGTSASANKSHYCNCTLNVQGDMDSTNLERAYAKVAQLPDFQKIPESEIKTEIPYKLGKVQGVGYGNADPRETVLGILGEIPSGLLYRELRDETDYIVRFYIEEAPDRKVQMLVAYVGHGGNDLFVLLFSGVSKKKYQKYADSENLD